MLGYPTGDFPTNFKDGADFAALSVNYSADGDWIDLDQEWFLGGSRTTENGSLFSDIYLGNAYVIEYQGQEKLGTASGGGGNDTLLNIENVIGTNFDDTITGNFEANAINGLDGNDLLNGGAGNDILTGGLGYDTAVYAGDPSDYTVVDNGGGSFTITDNNPADGDDGTDDLSSIERALFLGNSSHVALANFVPTAPGLPTDLTVTEDIASNIDLSAVTLTDFDIGSGSLTVTLNVSNGTLAAADGAGLGAGVTEVLSNGNQTLTLVGALADLNSYLHTAANIQYTSVLNGNGDAADTIDITLNDGQGSGDAALPVVNININITSINDAPVLAGDLASSVDEGGSVVIAAADLGFTDPDDDGDGVTFTVSSLSNGVVQVNGMTQSTFTGTQLAAGQVTFLHDGSETISAGFQVSVEDGNEDSSVPTAQAFSLTVTPVNDAPAGSPTVVLADGAEDIAYVVSAADLLQGFTDADMQLLSVGNLVSSVGSVTDNMDATYTINLPQDFNGPITLTYDVTDGTDSLTGQTRAFDVTPVNDAPLLSGDFAATVDEGGSVVIAAADLGFTDADDDADGVTFTVSGLTNGVVQVNGMTQSTFSGTQLAAGQVTFLHDGSETISAGFQVSVEDGNEDSSVPAAQAFILTVTPVNDEPVLTGDLMSIVDEGGSVVIGASDLGFTDPDDDADGVTFTVSSQANGAVQINGTPQTTFTGTQLAAGQVTFLHDGSETVSAGFQVSVEDGNEDNSVPAAQAFSLTVTPVNEAPRPSGDFESAVDEGGSVVIDVSDLFFTDPDDLASGITFTASALINGIIQVDGVTQNTFTGDDIQSSLVTFVHDGSETPSASFHVIVEDGGEDLPMGSGPVGGQFNLTITPVNDAPVLAGDLASSVDEGGSVVIGAADLGFTDPDNDGDGVTFTVSSLSNGVVQVNGMTQSTFTGTQLAAGQVVFVHDGSQTLTASFDVTVEDGNEDGSVPLSSPFNLAVTPNVAPTAVTVTPLLSELNENADTIGGIKVADVFIDDDALGVNTLGLTGADKDLFEFRNEDNTGGELFFIGTSPDFETKSSYDVTVTVEDMAVGAMPDAMDNFALTINNISPEFLFGTAAADVLIGGSDVDIIRGLNGNDRLFGNNGNDSLFGGNQNDFLRGGTQNDQLRGDNGNDRLFGDGGNDLLVGGLGRDIMNGGAGRDRFDYDRIQESRGSLRDRIDGFRHNQDDIDLRTIDANTTVGGNQRFKFIGDDSFNRVAGELHIRKVGAITKVEGDINGDGRADFTIDVTGGVTLTAGDFLL